MADADADADDGVYARVEVNQRALIDKVRGYHNTTLEVGGRETTSSSSRSFSFFFRSLFFFRDEKQKQKQKRNALPTHW